MLIFWWHVIQFHIRKTQLWVLLKHSTSNAKAFTCFAVLKLSYLIYQTIKFLFPSVFKHDNYALIFLRVQMSKTSIHSNTIHIHWSFFLLRSLSCIAPISLAPFSFYPSFNFILRPQKWKCLPQGPCAFPLTQMAAWLSQLLLPWVERECLKSSLIKAKPSHVTLSELRDDTSWNPQLLCSNFFIYFFLSQKSTLYCMLFAARNNRSLRPVTITNHSDRRSICMVETER